MHSQMFFLFTAFILSFAGPELQAQITELKEKYSNQSGSEKIETGILIANELEDSPEEMVRFTKELVKFAEKDFRNSALHAKVLKALSDGYFYADSIEISNKYLFDAIQIAEKQQPIDTFVRVVDHDPRPDPGRPKDRPAASGGAAGGADVKFCAHDETGSKGRARASAPIRTRRDGGKRAFWYVSSRSFVRWRTLSRALAAIRDGNGVWRGSC